MARITFFVGKGGVGKTTVSTAYALHRAAKRPRARVLLLSSDPAHSLADVLETTLSNTPKRLKTAGRLWVRQIDPDRQMAKFLCAEREDILTLLNKGSLFTRDELDPLLDTSLPGMAEVAALLAIHDLLDSQYDEIVVDTAPMGHAIRLFQMPEHFARFLDVLETAASRDIVLARHFGGHVGREPALDRWDRMVQRVSAAFSQPESKIVLVTTPEPFSLNEAARFAFAFASGRSNNCVTEVVLNRVVETTTTCSRCRGRAAQARTAKKFLRTRFPKAEVFTGTDPGSPILGVERLRSFGVHVFEGRKLRMTSLKAPPAKVARVKLTPAKWPQLVTPLTLTLGKGGVGKTTISAALAYHHREMVRKEGVIICSIDPAPSLDDIFVAEIGDELKQVLRDRMLLAAEFDAMEQFQQWAGHLRSRLSDAMTSEQQGIHLDLSLDRKFLLALLEVVPPGVDEIFAIFRLLGLLQTGKRVVIDMAPTGHALEVLRTPERLLAWARVLLKTLAAHRTLPIARDAAVEIATLSQNVRELVSILRDGKRCQLLIVSLPEPLPDHETRRLLRALDSLEVPLAGIFINRVLMNGGRCPRCKLAARWQAASLASLRLQAGDRQVFVTREFNAPIAGAKALREFTRKLWQVV